MLADRKRAAGKRHDAALICLTCHGRNANLAMLTTRQPNHGPSKAQQAKVADAA